jgi:hypothetical protein
MEKNIYLLDVIMIHYSTLFLDIQEEKKKKKRNKRNLSSYLLNLNWG